MPCLSSVRASTVAPKPQLLRSLSALVGCAAFLFPAAAQNASAAEDTAAPAAAPVAATGTITGRVLNAANGLYLNKAVVTVEGTKLQTLTDNAGYYRLEDVPVGEVRVTASWLGEKPLTVTAQVTGDAPVSLDLVFNNEKGNYSADGTIMLNTFAVEAQRYKTAAEIAVNEERNSVNIKNVVSADSFGDIPGGNVGEFVKFLPGVQVDYGSYGGANYGYSDSVASGISVRGFGPEDTAILIDGMPVSNATPGSLTRQVGLDMLSINNASRVELIKVATPDMPANSVGGQVNLVTKSAFELAKPSYSGRVFVNYNSLQPLTLSKQPGPAEKKNFRVSPGSEFSVSYPVSKKFGFSFTGYAARQMDQTYRAQPTTSYTTTSTSKTASNADGVITLSNPIISRFQITDNPRMTDSTSANIKLDWRPTNSQTVSANVQFSNYTGIETQHRLDFAPYVASGADWGSDYTIGVKGNNSNKTDMTVYAIDKKGDTVSGQLQYHLQLSGWDVSAAGSLSVSNGQTMAISNGHFSEVDLKLNPGQVVFGGIKEGIPGTITTYQRTTAGGGIMDFSQLSNYSLDGSTAKDADAHSKNTVALAKLDVERNLDFIPWLGSNALTIKAGYRRDSEKTEKWGRGTGYAKVIDTSKSSYYTVANVLDDSYLNQSLGFGFPAQQWASPYKLYKLDQQYGLFVDPAASTTAARDNWYSYVGQQKDWTETRDAFYGMLTGRFFSNRLTFVGGLRQEQNTRKGKGPHNNARWFYAKNPDGTSYIDKVTGSVVDFRKTAFLSDSALLSRMSSAGVWYPDHVLNSSGNNAVDLEGAQLARQALYPVNAKQKGKATPSINMSYAVTKKIDVRAAWSVSHGMPKLEDTSNGLLSGNGSFTVTDYDTPDSAGYAGEITVANPSLKPSDSTNWDYQVSYYTDSGGKFSVSYWTKSVTNQSQTILINSYTNPALFASICDAIGVDAAGYENYKITTSTNSTSTQKTSGWEYEVRQDFSFLGAWGKHFQTFASFSMNTLGTPAAVAPVTLTTPSGSTVTMTPTVSTISKRSTRFFGGGLQFSTRRFSAQVRGTWKNDNETQRTDLGNGNYLRQFEPAATRIDINANVVLSKHYSLFLSGKDVFNAERRVIYRDDFGVLPAWARAVDYKRFGVAWTFGVNGSW